jgi:hypothetical protein
MRLAKPIKPDQNKTRADAASLDRLMTDLTTAHKDLLASIHAHRHAMRQTDLEGMAAALAAQSACVDRIGALEQQRNLLAKAFSGPVASRGPISISDMARAIGGQTGDDLLVRAAALRGLMQQVREEQGALGSAAVQLAAHIEGLMRLVVQKLSTAGVYGRSGRIDVPRAALSLDLKS